MMNIKISGWLVTTLSALLLAGLVIMLMAVISESAELDIKVDTIGVDTVGCEICTKVGSTVGVYDLNLKWLYDTTDTTKEYCPILEYTTDTTYRLNRVQIQWLGYMENPVVCTSLACGYKDIHIGACKKITPDQGK